MFFRRPFTDPSSIERTTSDVTVVPSARLAATARPVRWLLRGPLTLEAVLVATFVVAATVVYGAISAWMTAPWIIPDETLYSGLARSVASGELPAVRGVTTLSWGVLYPLLIAPAWLMFRDPQSAYHAALVVNALVMSLAAIPAYLLARMFVSARHAVLVGLFALLIPSMAYTGVVMTENAFYPAFLLTILAMARAIEHPTWRRQLVALVAIGALGLVRPQGYVLVGTLALSAVLYGMLRPAGQRTPYIRRFVPGLIFALAAVGAGAGMVATTVAGVGFGSYAGVGEAVRPWAAVTWLGLGAAELVLYVAVIPAIATLVVVFGRSPARWDRRRRLFVALAVPIILTMLTVAALVASAVEVDGHHNINERYVFYVVPLFFIGLAVWIEEGMPRPRVLTAGALVVGATAPLFIPLARVWYNADFQTLALRPWLLLDASEAQGTTLLLAVFTVTCAILCVAVGPARRGHLWLVVGTWSVFLAIVAVGGFKTRSLDSSGRLGGSTSWVDDATDDHSVTALWDERRALESRPESDYQALMVTEVLNRNVETVLRLGPPTYYENVLPSRPVVREASGLVTDSRGEIVSVEYVLAPCDLGIVGTGVARAVTSDLTVYRVFGALRVDESHACRRPASPAPAAR
jgi:hypothetical protein